MADAADGSLNTLLAECLEAIDRGEQPDIEVLCKGNDHLAQRLRERLAVCRAIDEAVGAVQTDPVPPAEGEVVGGWKLGRTIGEGGFGRVYEASRVSGHEGLAAVKLLHRGAFSAEARSRFQTEADALSLVRHPHVASILESGVTEAGTPYLVLELIVGSAIDAYCGAHGLGMLDRISLMLQVCRTIEHAHAKGVLHRDLKPSNVLVMNVGGEHVPKIIDFGIARFIDGVGPDRTRVTAEGQVLGTARYMSPEQLGVIDGLPDTRSDIYSLGVMLYELVAGMLPYEDDDDRISSVYALQQRMRSTEPRGLTSRIAREGSVSARELGWIAMRCLEINPARRYATCRELADDLQRLVSGEAVHAGPRSRVYLTRKFVARHRGLVGAVSAAAIGLVVAAIGTSWGLVQARAETARTRAAEAESRRIIEFQYDLLRNLDPAVVGAAIAEETLARTAADTPNGSEALSASAASVIESVSMTDIGTRVLGASVFEPAIRRIDRDFADSPTLRGRLLNSIGKAQQETGLVQEGLETYRRSYHMLLESIGADAEQTLITQRDFADALRQANRPDEAIAILNEVQSALEVRGGEGDEDSIVAVIDQGAAFYNAQQLDKAEERWRKAVELTEAHLEPGHELANVARGNLGLVLTDLGRHEQAESYIRETREQAIDQFGEDHHQSILVTENLARCLALQGKADAAIELYREVVERANRVLGKSHPHTVRFRSNYLAALIRSKAYEEGFRESEQHLEFVRAHLKADDPVSIMAHATHVKCLVGLERYEEALPIAQQASLDADCTFGEATRHAANVRVALAEVLAGLGRINESLPLCVSAYRVLAAQMGTEHKEAVEIARLIVRVAERAEEGAAPLDLEPRIEVWRERAARGSSAQ